MEEHPTSSRLDHLPIIGNALKRLRIREHVDERIETHSRSEVTAGECVEALIAAILLGKHTLYRVDELLVVYDLEVAFGWRFKATSLNDTRLAKALDDLFNAGPASLHAAVVATAVEVYALLLKRLHFDTTSVPVHGAYELSREPDDPEEPDAIPHLTYGHSKDHRPDLKQFVLSLTASADEYGAVPIMGRAVSGNRSDSLEGDSVLRDLAQRFDDLSKVVLVADSKFFGGRRLHAVECIDLNYVTLVPRSVGLQRQTIARYREETAGKNPPLLKTKQGRSESEGESRWCGRSYDVTYEWDAREDGEGVIPLPLRALVVESPKLREKKRHTLEKRLAKEGKRISKRVDGLAKREFHCREDAEEALAKFLEVPIEFHVLEGAVRQEEVRVKRARPGRPRKDETPRTRRAWRIDVNTSEDRETFEDAVFEKSCFVLATNLPRDGEGAYSDAEVLEAYDQQHTVETCMAWAKGPLAVAPIFLKTPERIASLSAVYVLALMTHALIQRDTRRRLKAADTTMPGNRGQGWTARPTTQVLFRLFEGINTLRGADPEGRVLVTNMNTEQMRILGLLRVDELDVSNVLVVEPTVPRRGRAAKPIPRASRAASSKKRKRRRKQPVRNPRALHP